MDNSKINQYSHPTLRRGRTETNNNSNERAPRTPRQRRSSLLPTNFSRRVQRWQWPRSTACCLGVIFPLNMLVVISLIFGMLFGKLEMQGEFDTNDAFIRSQMADFKYSNDLADVLYQLPTLCLALLEKDTTLRALPEILEHSMTNKSALQTYLQIDANSQDQQVIPANKTVQELSHFLAQCGEAGRAFQESWLGLFNPIITEDTTLSFNYIRCVNRSSPLAFNAIIKPKPSDTEDAKPSTQAKLYEESWKKNQQELEEAYLKEYPKVEALTKSYADATGSEKCAINMPSAAWFWFTVMSTVGYGNQVPKSFWGRFMTYTLGFLSILLFGGVLATAGTITTHLMNDFIHRLKRKIARPVMILIWGTLWCSWMFVMSFYMKSFQKLRLGDDMSFEDAYWLAFISTTTIGFGDYYLQPEGLFVSDLLALWTTFLIGFVLLSSFLTELSNLFGGLLPDLGANLQRKLKYAYDTEVPEEVLSRGKRNSTRNISTDLETSADAFISVSEDAAGVETKADHENNDDKPHPKETNAAHEPVSEQAPVAVQETSTPYETTATFINSGTDPSMAKALLYHEATFWGSLGHDDPPVTAKSVPGHRWFIVANGVYAKQFTVGEEAQQEFSF